jgi:diguanylate cyclase (GGDEF)-like protein
VTPTKCSLLVVDDEPYLLPTLAQLLADDFDVLTADSAFAAEAVLNQRHVDLILTDQRMPRRTGVQLLEWVRENHPRVVRMLMTGYAELEDAVEAINRGHVYHYFFKPWRIEELQQVLRNAAEKFHLEQANARLLQQLQQLNGELRALNQGLEGRVAQRTQELEQANALLLQRTRELEQANALLQQRTREAERLMTIDPLTSLNNRREMEKLGQAELKRHDRYDTPLALGLLDIDHFKQINSDHLLTGGDEVLKTLARTLQLSIRAVDSVGRVGGEEFLILASELNAEGTVRLAERIRHTVAATPILYHRPDRPDSPSAIRITASLGFAVAEAGVPADYTTMYETAAAALDEAKRTGRNRTVVRSLPRPQANSAPLGPAPLAGPASPDTPAGDGGPSVP